MRFVLGLFIIPLLLAPVRFQQGNDVMLLQPTTAPTGVRGAKAVALPSPTVIDISPTRAPFISTTLPTEEGAAGTTLSPTAATPVRKPKPTPVAPAPVQPTEGMSAKQAALCVRSLAMVNDLSVASMKESKRENLVDLTIAAAIAQVQAAQGQWPMLEPLKQAGLPWFVPYRNELKQALNYSENFCANPNAVPVRQGFTRPR